MRTAVDICAAGRLKLERKSKEFVVNYSAATATIYRYCNLLTHLVRRQIGKLQKHSRVPHIHVVAVFHFAETRVFVVRHQLRCAGDKDVWRAASLKSASAGRAYEHLLQVSLNPVGKKGGPREGA